MGGPRGYDAVLATLSEDAALDEPPVFDLWFVQERETGRLVGHRGLPDKEVEGREEVELVHVIARNAWGRGYATEAATAIRDFALRELDQPRLVALIDPENAASERVAQKAGFGFEREVARPDGKTKRLYAFEKKAPGS